MLRRLIIAAAWGMALSWGVFAGSSAFGQSGQGGIVGRVLDSAGGAAANVLISATEQATGRKLSSTSNAEGFYSISDMPVGTYTVSATLPGFETVKRTPVVVSTAVNTTLDFELKPGAVTQVVTVQGASPLLQTEDAQQSTVVPQDLVMDLPLQMSNAGTDASGRRQMDNFIFLTPGVTGNQFSKSFNGSSTFQQEVILDGGIASGPLTPGLVRGFSPPYDAIQEFNVQSSMYPAEFVRGFGVINYNMKSGTNRLHGNGFEFVRNNIFDVRPFFSSTVPIEKQNEYGFTVGGPVILPKVYNGTDKTFFYVGFTGFQLRKGAAASDYVTEPTTAMTQGNFSALLASGIQLYDPLTTAPDGAGGFARQPFAGNIIPTTRFDTSAAKLLPYVPIATLNQPFNNYLDQTHAPVHDNSMSIKFDHTISSRQRVSYTYFWDWDLTDTHSPIAGQLDNVWSTGLPGGGTSASHYFTISSNVLNTFTASYMNNGLRRGSYTNTVGNSVLGIPNVPNVAGWPCMNISGFPEWGAACGAPLIESDRGFQLRDTVSWIKGRHSFKFGMDLRHGNSNQNIAGQGGTFNFSNLETSLPNSATPGQLGYGFASFLLGQVDSANGFVGGDPTLGVRTRFYSWFAQDQFRLSNKISLSYGVDIDRAVPYYDNYYRMSSLNLSLPNAAAGGRPGALQFAGFGTGRIGRDTFVSPVEEVSPRFAVTYAFNNKTLLRSGWGIYYSAGNNNVGQGTEVGNFLTGFFLPQSFASTNNGVTPGIILSQGFPPFTGTLPNLNPTIGNGGTVDYYNQDSAHSPTLQSWTFDVQRELTPSTLLDVAYVGQHGYRLGGQLENLNQVPSKYLSLGSLLTQNISAQSTISSPYPGFNGSVAQALRPFPQYIGITDDGEPTGKLAYEGLQTKLQRRLSQGLDFLVSYTLSKTIVNNGSQAGYTTWAINAKDTYNRGLEKSIAGTDQTHVLSISYVYHLPFGPGQHFSTRGGAAGRAASGWEVAAIQTYQSGTPISISGGPSLPLFGGSNRPNQVPGVPVRTSVNPASFNPVTDRFLNINAFSQPAPYTFGTTGNYLPSVRGFPNYNEGISVIKDTHFTESTYLQLRVETFNTFNRVVFSAPASNINTTSTFGVVSGQANSGRIIQFGIKIFY